MSDTQQPQHIRVPVMRRLWLVILLTCLIIPFPLAMIILLSGPVYRWREDGWQPIGAGSRYVYGGLLALWLVAVIAKGVLAPGGMSGDWAKSANPDAQSSLVAKNSSPSQIPAGGGVKGDDYQDSAATQPRLLNPNQMPADQREYLDRRTKLVTAAKSAGEGTRTYDENWKEIEALNASMDGKDVSDWICIIPAGEGGTVRENMRTLACTGDGDNSTRFNLFFDDPTILHEATYPGDKLIISGTIENKGSGRIDVHPTAAAIIQKSK